MTRPADHPPPARKLFGTDGIRGLANEFPMTPEVALKVGAAVTWWSSRSMLVA
jgi:phosphoglucosamine mutase